MDLSCSDTMQAVLLQRITREGPLTNVICFLTSTHNTVDSPSQATDQQNKKILLDKTENQPKRKVLLFCISLSLFKQTSNHNGHPKELLPTQIDIMLGNKEVLFQVPHSSPHNFFQDNVAQLRLPKGCGSVIREGALSNGFPLFWNSGPVY